MSFFKSPSIQNLRSKQQIIHQSSHQSSNLLIARSRTPSSSLISDLQLEIFKDHQGNQLGPGFYNTPVIRQGPSYSFCSAPRIKLPTNLSLIRTNSANIVERNKEMSTHTPENKKIQLDKKISQRNLNRILGKETKKLLEISKIEQLKKKINSKFNRLEVHKRGKQKVLAFKTYSTMILCYFTCLQLANKLRKVKYHKNKVHKYLLGIAVICKALGKFKHSLTKIRTSFAIKVFKKYLAPRVRSHFNNLRIRHRKVLLDVTEHFFIFLSMSRINYIIHNQITLIQKAIRNFLVVTNYRKHALRILWNKLDSKQVKITNKVQNFYVSSYLLTRISKFISYDDQFKIQVRSLISGKKIFRSNTSFVGRIERPVLKVFNRKYVIELIEKAYRDRKKWKDIKFVRFSIPLEKVENSNPNTRAWLKRRNTMKFN